MKTYLNAEAVKAAQLHALEAYPKESCGVVVDEVYHRCENVAENPELDFKISVQEYARFDSMGVLKAVIHSHPNALAAPSAADMQGQIASGVVWGIVSTDGERASEPFLWGDQLPIAPIIGRPFIHGISDCFSLIRDCFRLGKVELAKQGVTEWPYDPVVFPIYPRNDEWWAHGENLYEDNFGKIGWREITQDQVRPGDAFMLKVKSDKLNHAGLYIGNGLILHHLPTRVSRREPVGIWARSADIWLRWEGLPDAS